MYTFNVSVTDIIKCSLFRRERTIHVYRDCMFQGIHAGGTDRVDQAEVM